IERVLDTSDISDEVATHLVKQIKASIGSADVKEVLKIQKLAQGTSLEEWFRTELLFSYASDFYGQTHLVRALASCLSSSDQVIQDFGQRLLAKADDPRLSQFRVVKALQEITELQRSSPALKDFTRAATAWMKSEKVSPELKSSLLLADLNTPA